MEKVYSNKLNQGVIDFIDARFGKVITDEILARIHLDRLTLTDPSGFVSEEVTHALNTAAMELTGERRIAYLAGRNLPNSLGKVGGFMVGITSPAFFMKSLGEIEGRLALKTINTTTRIGRNRFRVEITYKDGFKSKPYTCENRIGCYESAPLFFGLPYAKVEHPQCAHRNEGNCVYIVHFPEFRFLVFKRLALALSAAAAALVLYTIATSQSTHLFTVSGALLVAALSCLSVYKHLSAKKSLEWSLLANEGLLKQNQMLESMNFKLTTLQKMNEALMDIRTAERACTQVVQGLVREFRFGSSQIWLVDEAGETLSCAAAEGYSPKVLAMLKNARFDIGRNWDHPHDLLAQTLKEGKTLLANDMAEVLPRMSRPSREFFQMLKTSSFIMTPISHGGTPLGILAGEYYNSEKIEGHDQLVFQSLSHVLSSTLVKSSHPIPKKLL